MSSSYMHSWPGFEGAAEPHPSMPNPIILAPNLHQRERREEGPRKGCDLSGHHPHPVWPGCSSSRCSGPGEPFWACLP